MQTVTLTGEITDQIQREITILLSLCNMCLSMYICGVEVYVCCMSIRERERVRESREIEKEADYEKKGE